MWRPSPLYTLMCAPAAALAILAALSLAVAACAGGAGNFDDAKWCLGEEEEAVFLLQARDGRESSEVLGWPRKPKAPGAVRWPGAEAQPPMRGVRQSLMSLNPSGSAFAVTTGRKFPAGYNKGYPPYTEHFQGIQRYENHLYISGSGETAGQAEIIVLDLASRSARGPMRGASEGPEARDRVVRTVEFDGEYWHAGGFSVFGKVLAVGAESGCSATERLTGRCQSKSRVHFFDLSDPSNPTKLPYVVERASGTAGAVALTQEVDGRYLLLVGGVDSSSLDFYRSSHGSSLDADPGFQKFATWDKASLLVSAGASDSYYSYQTLNFVRQSDGELYMMGFTRTMHGFGSDVADLFLVDNSREDAVTVTKVAGSTLSCPSHTCNFVAGAGAFIESDNSLYIYATNYEPSSGKIYITEFKGGRSAANEDEGSSDEGRAAP